VLNILINFILKRSYFMKMVIKCFIPVFIAVVLLSLNNFSCSQIEGKLLGETNESPIKKNNSITKAHEIQDVFREIYDLYKNSVVWIETEQTVKTQNSPFFDDPFFRDFFGNQRNSQPRTQKRSQLGTGFIISEDGYICTNHHVVQGVDKVTVKVDDKSYDAEVIASDEQTDIALIKIKSDHKLNPAFLGDSDKVRVGDWAIAIGNPLGLDKTFTVGVVSATGRKDMDLRGGSLSHIQTDASINPGNSGGPLINIDGEVIGVNRMIASASGFSQGNIGIGFAIPINTVKTVIDDLKKYKKVKRGFIGIGPVPLTDDYADELGIKDAKGVLIGQVEPDSPADKGGLMVGDVIIMIGEQKVDQVSDIYDIIGKTQSGKTLKIKVIRQKKDINLFVTVKER
jgi:serine protease Do